jgi:hypothetical protein
MFDFTLGLQPIIHFVTRLMTARFKEPTITEEVVFMVFEFGSLLAGLELKGARCELRAP